MIRTALALAFLLALAACSADEDPATWPDIEDLYEISGLDVSCAGTVSQYGSPSLADPTGPILFWTCNWRNVMVRGDRACVATITFRRPSESEPWEISALLWQTTQCPTAAPGT